MKPLHIMVMAAAALPMADLVLSGELSSQYPEANADECDGTSRSSDQGPTPGHKRHRQAEGTSTIGATDPPSTLNIDADIRSPYRIVSTEHPLLAVVFEYGIHSWEASESASLIVDSKLIFFIDITCALISGNRRRINGLTSTRV
mmetsp:Transcript_33188/g.66961  ORF Transcript_33188/g.66961 Transcript_33188/m.66961 type:complete len:145 (-) Transcript_33188:2464-2898(-)